MKRLFLLAIMAIGLLSYGSSFAQNANSANSSGNGEVAQVYFTKEITPEALMKVYEALDRKPTGKVAVKLHMGEPGGNNFLKPTFTKDFVSSFNGTFIDACTAYGGRRTTPADHMKVAEEHGFTAVAPVDIIDADGEITLPVTGGKHLKEVYVGSHLDNYDFVVILTHFKGHAMGGFGGALKNVSIGMSTVKGKNYIHSAGQSTDVWGKYEFPKQEDFIEAMAEGAQGILNHLGDKVLYINVMNNLSVDCDCSNAPADPEMHDVGILASFDPVALDKACVDLVYASKDHGKIHLIERMESRKGSVIIDHAEKLGVGTQKYNLVSLD